MRFPFKKVAPLIVTALSMLFVQYVSAQERVKVGGTAYLDAFYNLTSPVEDAEDLNGFTYRRLFLTADFVLSDAFSGRARLEANEGTTGAAGPVPFVKDLYLRWKSTTGHRVTAGVTSPPAFDVAEEVWGYRSLEKTTLDLFGVVSSRDFGVRVDGPLAAGGRLRYHAMLANNSGVKPEANKYKRVYGMLEARPTDALVFTAGADYATYPGEEDAALRLSAFGGYDGDAFSAGVEVFAYRLQYATDDERTKRGLSVYAHAPFAEGWEIVGRVDRVTEALPAGPDGLLTFFVVGVAYVPTGGVRLIPNLHYLSDDRLPDPALTARMTVELNF